MNNNNNNNLKKPYQYINLQSTYNIKYYDSLRNRKKHKKCHRFIR